MISFVRGQVHSTLTDSLIVDVNGIGYQVFISAREMSRIPKAGQPVFLHTYLQILENEWKLYGFTNRTDLELFLRLLAISGLGARSALNILSAMTAEEFYRAIASQDERSLVKIPGIGKKSAQRLLFEMKDKVGDMIFGPLTESENAPAEQMEDLFQALEVLGYSRSEILPLVMQLREAGEIGERVEDNIRKVLRMRSGQLK
ncbi:MAG: Holliday junction branch migration protein RuvA [Syntrophomonadaceae bacterium]